MIKRWIHRCLPIAAFALAPAAMAYGRIESESFADRIQVSFMGEFTYFSGNDLGFSGSGPFLGVRYALSNDLAIGFAMSQGLTIDNGLAALYSSFKTTMHWALSGSLIRSRESWRLQGQPFMEFNSGDEQLIYLHAGLDQYILNGSESIYPASGFTFGAGMEIMQIWGMTVTTEVSAGLLVVNTGTAVPISARLGGSWGF